MRLFNRRREDWEFWQKIYDITLGVIIGLVLIVVAWCLIKSH